MAFQNLFVVISIVLGASIALGEVVPLTQTNANIGIIPAAGGPAFGPDLGLYAFPKYNYHYSGTDPVTGDFKTHREERDGEDVIGEFALQEPDGAIRHVRYVADSEGFRSNVFRTRPRVPFVPAVPAVPAIPIRPVGPPAIPVGPFGPPGVPIRPLGRQGIPIRPFRPSGIRFRS